jgi:uncharacterized alpha-E superfamily protein
VYGNAIEPRDIASFLILDKRMPRSLGFCIRKIRDNLNYLVSNYGKRPASWAMADQLERYYLSHDIDAIFEYGLHEYIQKVLSLLNELGNQIEIDYRFNE